ncbi:lipase secretion chaperone [Noviherbaspirillum sp. ST9]|uniref:lipase secretion chaperone n=1 Tax=Noviherbaspirillum sp. ST9 TaxID=3401606 RepID=UPI003B58A5A0
MTRAAKGLQVLAVAALMASVIGGALLAGGEVPPAAAAREPDFFAFVRPLPHSITPESQHREPAPDPRWRAIFERHLELAGEGPGTHEAIARESGGLTPAARDALDKYLRYRRQMRPLQAAIDEGRDVPGSIAALQALRAELFSSVEREMLFPADDAYEGFLLARQALIADATLGDDERHHRLLQLEASLSPETRQVEEMRGGIVRLAPSLQPGDEEDVYRLAPGQ